MKNSMLMRLICLALACSLALFAFVGCKGKTSADVSSEPSASVPEDTVEEPTTSEDPSDEDWGSDEEPDDGLYEDMEEIETPTDSDDSVLKETIDIHNKEIINDNFRGINYVYSLYQRMPDHLGRVYTEKQLKHEYDTIEKMGMSMIRSFYGSSISWDPVKQVHDYESEYMKAFYQSCKDMEKLGIDVGVTMSWDLKSFLQTKVSNKQCVDLYLNGYVVPGDMDATMRNFGKFVEESVLAFKAHGVNNVKYIYAFTEANNLYGTTLATRKYEEVIPLYEKALIALDEGLKSSGLRKQYKIVAPCDNWRNDGAYSRLVQYTLENLADRADIIGSHQGYPTAAKYIEDFYYNHALDKLGGTMQEAMDAGKEFWADETNASIQGMLSVKNANELRTIKEDPGRGVAFGAFVNGMLNSGGISNMLIWSLADQQWPGNLNNTTEFDNGVHLTGLLPNLMESTTPTPTWYAASMLTRYIGRGKIYNVTDAFGLYASAIEREDGEITIVVTNYNFDETTFDLFFDESLGGKTFYRYTYEAAEIKPVPGNEMIKPDSIAKQVTTGFTDAVSGMSVSVYTTVKD